MSKRGTLQKPDVGTPSTSGSAKKQRAMTDFFKRTAQPTNIRSPPSPSTPVETPSPELKEENADVEVLETTATSKTSLQRGGTTKAGSSNTSSFISTPTTAKRAKPNGRASAAKRIKKEVPESPEDIPDDSDKDPDFTEEGQISDSSESEVEPEIESDEEDLVEESDNEGGAYETPQKRKRGGGGKGGRVTSFSSASRSVTGKGGRKGTASKVSKGGGGVGGASGKKVGGGLKGDTDDVTEENGEGGEDEEGDVMVKHTHESLPWLHPDKIRDKNKVLHKDILAQGLTPRTLYVPSDFVTTPALKQWWAMKSDYFDCILFFKLGKFYEMYHMDADVAVRELGLIYMRGEAAHCGFPEAAFSRWANKLVEKGYKVVRVEQTMTPAEFKLVEKKDSKALPREIIRIHTPGTMSISTLECESEKREDGGKRDASCLLTICEKIRVENGAERYEYGVCLLYPGPGTFLVGQFTEDRYHSRLRTLLAQHTPNEIILEKGSVSQKLNKILQNNVAQAQKEFLLPLVEFSSASDAVRILLEREYFGSVLNPQWPPALASMLQMGGTLPVCKPEYELAFRALGGSTWYLKRCEIDLDMLSLKNFEVYLPADQPCPPGMDQKKSVKPKHMVLDGVTLVNLDIVPSGDNPAACLMSKINRCKTKFGLRLLKEWIVAPLFRIPEIVDRQAAIASLSVFKKEDDRLHQWVMVTLKTLPDLERLLTKVHIVGSLQRRKVHPETRAVMFDDAIYSKRKIKDFLATIKSFSSIVELIKRISDIFSTSKSYTLKSIVTIADASAASVGSFPDLEPVLEHFLKSFDAQQAEADGMIKPKKGIDPVYDEAVAGVREVENWFENHLVEQVKRFKCKITYFGSAKNRYQLEIPVNECDKVPSSFELTSQRKGFKRYRNKEILLKLEELEKAEREKEVAVKDCTRRVFEKFDNHYAEWMKAVRCMAILDVLFCLEEYSSNLAQRCVPVLKEASEGQTPFFAVRDGRHPLVVTTYSGGDFIPNDTFLGVGEQDDPSYNGALTLVTGPNMGGKSTLMRQIGLITVLAQLGSNVPATSCEMTPVDRIFTRIGASDNLLAGESTFFVELSETSSILQHATENSLVLVDELGRGTATFDGTAVAAAVLKDLSTRLRCRTLFSTHYHSLVERFSGNPNIKLGHMACLVENENEEDPTKESITFLYKFIRGACPKSYGFNAAKLAGLSDTIVKRAHEKAVEMEKLMLLGKMNVCG